MKRVLAIVAPVVLAATACGGRTPDEEAARAAFDALVKALDDKDPAALWQLSDDGTHACFEDLAAEIKAAVDAIDRLYPEADRAAARRAVGGDWVGPATRGPALFERLLDTTKLAGPADAESRVVAKVVVGGDTATLFTQAGDTFEFTRDPEGRYRTGLFRTAFQDLPAVATLKDNLSTVKQNAAILARPAPAATPPAPPQGGQP